MKFNTTKLLRMAVSALFMALVMSAGASSAFAGTGDTDMGPNLISSIETVKSDEGTTINIQCLRHANYTVFKLRNPSRIIVDISGAAEGAIKPSYQIRNGLIREITVTSIGDSSYPITRLGIFLEREAQYNVTKDDALIRVELKGSGMFDEVRTDNPDPALLAVPAPVKISNNDLVPPPVNTELDDGDVAAVETEKIAPVDIPLHPARNISDIDTTRDRADVLNVKIKFDGKIGAYDAFEMRNPPRLVVDFWNVGTTRKMVRINLMEPELKSIRVGKHHNKVRIVFDATSRTEIPYYSFTKKGDLMVVQVSNSALNELSGKKEDEELALASIKVAQAEEPPLLPPPLGDEDDAEEPPFAPMLPTPEPTEEEPPAAEEPPPATEEPMLPPVVEEEPAAEPPPAYVPYTEPAAEPPPAYVPYTEPAAEPPPAYMPGAGHVTVEGVDFDYTKKKSTIAITTSGRAEYEVLTNERSGVVSILIKNATIPAQLERTLDTSEFISYVRFVSSFQSGSGDTREVYVSIGVDTIPKHYVIREGNRILAIFHNPPQKSEIGLKGDIEYAGKDDEDIISVEKEFADLYFGGIGGVKKRVYTGRPIYIDAKGMDVIDAFRLIAEISHYNIIAADDVKGKVTLKLDNVPWDQAMDIILESKGLAAIVRGNIMRIAPKAKLQGEINAEKKRRVRKVIDAPILFSAIPISYADIKELKKLVDAPSVLTKRGTVELDERTNTLLVWDTRYGLEKVQRLVTTLDIQTPQVLIEARIVEATTGVTRDLGVRWGGLFTMGAAQGNPTGLNFPGDVSVGVGLLNGPDVITGPRAHQEAQNRSGDIGFSFGSLTDFLELDLALHALEIEERLKIISSPRILTLDNEMASIQQGSSIPFQTTSAAGTKTEFIDANLNLTVTPHVTADGTHIFLKIKASANTPVTIPTAQGPGIDKKEIKTQVLVKDGDTIVIGGIYVVSSSNPETRIPILGKIPFIGWLFRSSSKANSKRELLIFITPRIVTGARRASYIEEEIIQ